MKYEDIKFFSKRCEEHPDHQSGMITNSMIQQRLHEEIDELRAYIESQLAQPEQEPTYTSTQATNCAGCGERKHTPLRIDEMGGYVCLTCIDKKLGSLLGEFGYEQPAQEPVAWISQKSGFIAHNKPDQSLNPMPLYLAPPPCPTCEALARTVMLDQTSHDTTPPQRKPLTETQINDRARAEGAHNADFWLGVRFAEAAHGIKE
jgi:hypothetical protein